MSPLKIQVGELRGSIYQATKVVSAVFLSLSRSRVIGRFTPVIRLCVRKSEEAGYEGR